MARSFLFAQDDAAVATTRLIATAASSTGFMKGMPGAAPEGWYRVGGDNADFLTALHEALRQTYPDAGAAFHAVRLWTNLIWQPAYLAVIAVHLHGAVPDFSGLSQDRRGIYVDGFRLAGRPQRSGSVAEMIADAAGQLRVATDAMLAEVNTLERLRETPAKRLLAYRMAALMLWLGHRRREMSNHDVLATAAQWFGALDLGSHVALQPVPAGDGTEVLIVKRKGCCLDYLITPDRLCASCPKQPEAVRLQRQTANAVAERG
jgi:siderophore ferric iron reductase